MEYAYEKVERTRRTRRALIGALAKTGFVHYRLIESLGKQKRGTNAEDFKLFLTDLFRKIPRNSVVILDNAKIHHAETLDGVWELGKNAYGIDKLFLSPYSPFLNPIEYAFNALQNLVIKEEWFTRGELVETIKRKIPEITAEKAAFQGKPLDPQIPIEERNTEQLAIMQ